MEVVSVPTQTNLSSTMTSLPRIGRHLTVLLLTAAFLAYVYISAIKFSKAQATEFHEKNILENYKKELLFH